MIHPLKNYLGKHSITEAEFAEKVTAQGVDITASYISQIIIGYRKPRGRRAVAISDATNKAVTVDDLMRFERPAPAPRRRHRVAS